MLNKIYTFDIWADGKISPQGNEMVEEYFKRIEGRRYFVTRKRPIRQRKIFNGIKDKFLVEAASFERAVELAKDYLKSLNVSENNSD